MKSYVLSHGSFGDAYVKQIQEAIPEGWHCIMSRHPIDAAIQPPNVLCVIGGSPTQQKERTVRVRLGGGSSKGAFIVAVAGLREFFEKFSRDSGETRD